MQLSCICFIVVQMASFVNANKLKKLKKTVL